MEAVLILFCLLFVYVSVPVIGCAMNVANPLLKSMLASLVPANEVGKEIK